MLAPARPAGTLGGRRRHRLLLLPLLPLLLLKLLGIPLLTRAASERTPETVPSARRSAPKLFLQTARHPKRLPETAAKFMSRARWRHRSAVATATAAAKRGGGQDQGKPTYAPLQGILSLTHFAVLPVSRLCPTGECCYSNSNPVVVEPGSTIKISGKDSARETPPGEEERTRSNCIIFGHGNTQLIQIAGGGSLELEMLTLSHGRAAYGAAAHVDGVLISRESIFAWNLASHAGAALYVARPHGRFRGFDTRFIGNVARDEEGDIHVDKGARVECYTCHYQKKERVSGVHLGPGEEQHTGLSFRSHEDGVAATPFAENTDEL